jgi:CDP-glycerol glycerophosphotransferase (TagB/SpsB family)
MSSDDLQHLLDTLYHSSLLVAYPTSLVVDIAIFDKPIINIGFETRQEPDPYKRPTVYYGLTHLQKPFSTGAIQVVKNQEELAEWINRYLADPALDREARKKLVDQQCWKLDGRSGERIAQAILKV